MTNKKWNENKKVVYEIVQEMILDGKSPDVKYKIESYFNYQMNELYKSQYSFENYTHLNKHVIDLLHSYVSKIETNTSSNKTGNITVESHNRINMIPGTSHITREEIHNERESIIKQRLHEKQKELDNFIEKPKEIDFTDKDQDNQESIDDLLEKELAKRNMEFSYDTSTQDKANEWIYNSENKRHIEQNNTVPKLKIHNTVPIENEIIKPVLKKDTIVNNSNKNEISKNVRFAENTILTTPKETKTVTTNMLFKMKQIQQNRDKEKQIEDNTNDDMIKQDVIQNMGQYTTNHIMNEIQDIKFSIHNLQKDMNAIIELIREKKNYEKEQITLQLSE